MPKHEPEVLAAIRRRKPLGDRVVMDDSFPGAAGEQQVLRCPRCGSRYMHRGTHHETSCDSKADCLHIQHSRAKVAAMLRHSSWSSPITRETSSLSGKNHDGDIIQLRSPDRYPQRYRPRVHR